MTSRQIVDHEDLTGGMKEINPRTRAIAYASLMNVLGQEINSYRIRVRFGQPHILISPDVDADLLCIAFYSAPRGGTCVYHHKFNEGVRSVRRGSPVSIHISFENWKEAEVLFNAN